MPEDAPAPERPLDPANREDILFALKDALLFDRKRRVHSADDMMAKITADDLLAALNRSGFVVMHRRAPPPGLGPDFHPEWR